MENWLTKTIWGLLTIGTIGSIIAYIIIRTFKSLFQKIIPTRVNTWIEHKTKEKGTKFGKELADAISKGGKYGYTIYIIYHSTSLIIFVTLASLAFLTSIIIFVNGIFTAASFLFMIVAFLFFYSSIWKYLILSTILGSEGILDSLKEFIKSVDK